MIQQSPPAPGAVSTVRRWFEDGVMRRIFRNAGTLLGGKAVSALLALASLAVTARGLGPELFGILVLVHTYAKLIGGLTKFQSWQAVIRYGAAALERGAPAELQGLIKFTVLLDLVSAVIGVAIAMILAPVIGPWFGLDDDTVNLAMIYSALILFTAKATPTGILRLFDRFKLIAIQTTFSPAASLAGATIAWSMGGGLEAFLVVWFVAGAVDGLSLSVLGWREVARQGLLRGMDLSLADLTAPHSGIWKFVWSANIYTSLNAASSHLVTLGVGWLLGPSAAGLFKIASQFASVLVVPATLLRRSIYPELAKLTAAGGAGGGARAVRKIVARAGAVAGSVAVVAVVVLALIGEPLISLTVGHAYLGAYGVLVVLAAATAISIFGVALDPVFFAMGRPDVMLRVSVIIAALNLVLVFLFAAEWGLVGVGWASLVSTAVGIGVLIMLALGRLAKRVRSEAEAMENQGD